MVFDLFCAGLLGLFLVLGLIKGLVKQVFSLAGWIGGLLLARFFAASLAEELGPSLGLSLPVATVAFAVAIFIATTVLARLLANFLHDHLDSVTGTLNRVGGGALGLAKGLVIVWALASLGSLLHSKVPQAEQQLSALAQLDLENSWAAQKALDKNFLGEVQGRFGELGKKAQGAAKQAVEKAKESTK